MGAIAHRHRAVGIQGEHRAVGQGDLAHLAGGGRIVGTQIRRLPATGPDHQQQAGSHGQRRSPARGVAARRRGIHARQQRVEFLRLVHGQARGAGLGHAPEVLGAGVGVHVLRRRIEPGLELFAQGRRRLPLQAAEPEPGDLVQVGLALTLYGVQWLEAHDLGFRGS
ncbi:hypothetical protein D3C81_1617260 [compost metagenome]